MIIIHSCVAEVYSSIQKDATKSPVDQFVFSFPLTQAQKGKEQSFTKVTVHMVQRLVTNSSGLTVAGGSGEGAGHGRSRSSGSRLLHVLIAHDAGSELSLRLVETGPSASINAVHLEVESES